MKRFLLGLALVLAVTTTIQAKVQNKGNFGIAGWLVYWDPKSMESFERNIALIDRVYPEWYIIGADGLPRSNENIFKTDAEKATFRAKKLKTVQLAKKNGVQIYSMIVNFDSAIGQHSTDRVHKFLYDKAIYKKHIQALVENAIKDGAQGIDIDYENMKAVDAKPFNQFMADLKVAAKAKGLLLAAAIAPKTDADGTWDGNQAHDYKGLGQSLDLMRPMTYDEHWGTSTAGPVSSPEFTEMVDRYAVSVSQQGSVEIGIAAYGYDWKGKEGKSITWDDLMAMKKKGIKITRDPETAELTGRYKDEKGQDREFWFCDAGSYRPKYALIKKYKLAGMAIWRFGSEDPSFWTDVRQFKYAKDWK